MQLKIEGALRLFGLMVTVQWRDRIQTSSFLIGITLQTLLLSFGVLTQAQTADEALLLSVRAAGFTSLGILIFASMSSIANEFRYGTIENVLISRLSIVRLVGFRAASTAIISSPAILVPVLAAVIKFPVLFSLELVAIIVALYVLAATLCFQLSYLINIFEQPSIIMPSVKFVVMLLGFRLIPFQWSEPVSLIFPSGWLLRITGPSPIPFAFTGFLVMSVIWTIGLVGLLGTAVNRKVMSRLVTGRLQ